jgi:hypothetical protein
MALRDADRSGRAFNVDEPVRRLLAEYAQARDSDLGRLNLARGVVRLSLEQKAQLVERLAEISLGLLFALDARTHRTPEKPD